MMDKYLALPDERRLSYAIYGDPTGYPLIVMHGMPSSRLFGRIFDVAAQKHGIQVICPDRPGYGLSTPTGSPDLNIFAEDIAALADHLKLSRFIVAGVSGGSAAALACAAALPDRVCAVALVSGIGQLWLQGSMKGMILLNRVWFTLGQKTPAIVAAILSGLTGASRRTVIQHIKAGTSPTASIAPAQFVIVGEDVIEAIRQGKAGVQFDLTTIPRRWPFEPDSIKQPVYVWHGEADNFAPLQLTRRLVDQFASCETVYYPREQHSDTFINHSDEIMKTLASVCR